MKWAYKSGLVLGTSHTATGTPVPSSIRPTVSNEFRYVPILTANSSSGYIYASTLGISTVGACIITVCGNAGSTDRVLGGTVDYYV